MRKTLFFLPLLVLLWAGEVHANITKVAGPTCAGSSDTFSATVTTNATGGNAISVAVAYFRNDAAQGALMITDGTNTYHQLTKSGPDGTNNIVQAYAYNVSSGSINITAAPTNAVSTFAAICAIVFANELTTDPFDIQDFAPAGGPVTTIHPVANPPFTPSQDGEVIVTALQGLSSGADTIDSGFATPGFVATVVGQNYSLSMSYKIQTTASTVDPIWTAHDAYTLAANIASFKAGSAPPPASCGSSMLLLGVGCK